MIPGVTFLSTCRLSMSNPLACPSVAQTHILAACDRAALSRGATVQITCLAEGHPPTDPHTRRLAADIRTNDVDENGVLTLATLLESLLGPGWTILYEASAPPTTPGLTRFYYADPNSTGPHLHVQVQIGQTYP